MQVGSVYRSKLTGRYWYVYAVDGNRCCMYYIDGVKIYEGEFIVQIVIDTMIQIM